MVCFRKHVSEEVGIEDGLTFFRMHSIYNTKQSFIDDQAIARDRCPHIVP